MALITPFFLIAYSIKPYRLGQISLPENPSSRHGMQHYHGDPLGFYAVLQALNVFDIVTELLQGVKGKIHAHPLQFGNQKSCYPGSIGQRKRRIL
ncbi:hypothetical protein IMSHALPRED_010598 [Imshaugia aleurites]|uniref:Uncharacterized protein n=1 Tax=Imshaugia aleurites TaxID=172621 RepID=A0A8H3I1W0_9LECA|nr:hypothetical protein IMSHALPRED_010598 [Imshaugia aleurites]